MKIFGLAGWSGSGKTTLLVQLLPALVAHGLRVSTLKHAHHAFDVDQPGKDSYAHRAAGATEVMVASAHRWALMHELRGAAEPSVADLIAHMTGVDLLLIEGFKNHAHDRLEVYRRGLGKPLLCIDDPRIVAVASDGPVPETRAKVLDLARTGEIAAFILSHCGLTPRATGVGR
ncbi:MAG: molybdopterin-guanine dinucleotide biosynthesis protein B [Alphaproteobacteria bacterium]